MKPNPLYKPGRPNLRNVIFLFLFLCFSMALKAQTPADFSGKWEFDKTKSSPTLLESGWEGTVVMLIAQTSTTFTYNDTWIKPGESDFKTADDSYILDGKERTTTHDVGTNKRLALWSADKKALTFINIDTQSLKGKMEDFVSSETLTLSGDGHTLTVDIIRKNPVQGETKAQKVYWKK